MFLILLIFGNVCVLVDMFGIFLILLLDEVVVYLDVDWCVVFYDELVVLKV